MRVFDMRYAVIRGPRHIDSDFAQAGGGGHSHAVKIIAQRGRKQ